MQICNQMWSDDDGPYEGRHYQLAETICSPRPIQQPAPRVMIGGSGEKKTLRLVARYADACNLFGAETEVVKHKLDVLARHCETEDRDPESIEKTIITGTDPLNDVDGFLANMDEYARLGIEKVWISPNVPDPAAWVTKVTEQVLPKLEEIGTA